MVKRAPPEQRLVNNPALCSRCGKPMDDIVALDECLRVWANKGYPIN